MFVTLRDDNRGGLHYVSMALGWDPVHQRRWFSGGAKDIDLNASALLYAEDSLVDVVYHEQLMSGDGAVRHLGDSTTGEGHGDNEIVTVDLTRLAPEVTLVFFLVTCYTGQSFDQIENAFCRIVDGVSDVEIARYDLSSGGSYTGLILGKLGRSGNIWQFDAIGEGISARHPADAVPQLRTLVP
ncbi:TerD family protein [Nocardia ninae]|uniref:Tellurium resistance protein TerZ n=1 Tax=Nocardia ninae NBRC 108245 TaxID=1210091 RepID=A0A511MJ89_9NOCA|nr:TerD family protein [Nocardia ninae]GEM40725.1 tellurium resistance protein TerZ [Nocardia ninae NBRC 108245]